MNLFPCAVRTGADARLHEICRVVDDGRETTIWQWDFATRRPVILAEAPVLASMLEAIPAELLPLAKRGYKAFRLVTESAGLVTFVRQEDCGCGHPLKRLTPQRAPGARRIYTGPVVADGEPDTRGPVVSDAT